MRFGVIGGGPAGLYFAILMKQADPSHEVTVLERNPADATYGWGVVFSVDTLAELRDADYRTWLEIDDHIVRWDALDIRFRDHDIRAYGHGFSAISRRTLLDLLQRRARDLGVELEFEREITSPEVFADRDVIVAADGVNSTIRAPLEDRFGTQRLEHETRFAWFGAGLAFDAFTFIFKETEHGLFTVHAYPFDESTSTFIVEVSQDTWRSAGLDRMSEDESLSFCQELFAEDLEGAPLLSNRSIWISFTTLRNRSWHEGNLVLVGDAAHTAHFTIGSGTKLALEDSVALSKAFIAHGQDLDAAFAEYESERQLPVERFQEAAIDSAAYFANVDRYLGFSPEQFTMNLLTRSGRISHGDVEARDPTVANHIDAWLLEDATGAPSAGRVVVPRPAAVPIQVGALDLANRVVAAPTPEDDAIDGVPGDATRDALTEAARLGAGLVVTPPVAISAHGRVSLGSPGLYEVDHADAWAKITAEIHETGAAAALRLSHSGRRGSMRPRRGGLDRPLRGREAWTTIAPSAIPYTSTTPPPAPVDEQRFREVREDAVTAAELARRAGFDLLVLDWSDGYLWASFLSPLTNQRDDEHGGDLEGRMRWPLECLDAVADAWGGPLGVRLTMDDRVRGGLRPEEEGVEIVRRLVARGVAVVEAVAGHTVPRGGGEYRRLYQVPLADRARNEGGALTIATGAITTLDQIDTVVASGRADLCVLDPRRYQRPRIR